MFIYCTRLTSIALQQHATELVPHTAFLKKGSMRNQTKPLILIEHVGQDFNIP